MCTERTSKRLVLLNSSIVTAYGEYEYQFVALDCAKALLADFQQANRPIESFVSHRETADFLTSLLNVPVAFNRTNYEQGLEDVALVFKLRNRVPERCVLTCEEIEQMGYDFGLFSRTA